MPNKFIIHHSGGTDADPLADSSNFTFKQCDALHRVKFNFKSNLGFYCGYQYYIEKSGKTYQARSDYEEGAHTIGQNNSSIGICLAGNFDATLPTPAQTEALKKLLIKKTKEHDIDRTQIFPHRKYATKTCYGKRLSDTWASDLLSPISHEESMNNGKIQEQISWIRKILENLINLTKNK